MLRTPAEKSMSVWRKTEARNPNCPNEIRMSKSELGIGDWALIRVIRISDFVIPMLLVLFVLSLVGCAAQRQIPRLDEVDRAIARGVQYLVQSQRPDGSWGDPTETRGFEVYSMVPGTHDGMRVGTTSLCVMALREAGEKEAHARGLEHLLNKYQAKRDEGALIYNIWAQIYCTQAMAGEMRINADPRIAAVARWQIDYLRRYETHIGGWNYYDFVAHTQTPSMGPVSFGTAAALIALYEAKESGLELPPKMAEMALRRLAECRFPNGAYGYGRDYMLRPRQPANQLRGSVGRIQVCNDALWLWDFGGIGRKQVIEGLEVFNREHIYLEMGRKRPIPHEAWYQTAGYYYYYDHYYAARLCQRLGWDDARKQWPAVLDGILPYQEPDGSWWDFAMWGYHKPYGTAYAVMALVQYRNQLIEKRKP